MYREAVGAQRQKSRRQQPPSDPGVFFRRGNHQDGDRPPHPGGAGSYSRTTTITSGTLDLTGQNQSIGETVTVGTGSTSGVILSSSTPSTYSANSFLVRSGTVAVAMVGSGSLTKGMSGTMPLTGFNTYTGGTVLNEGLLRLGDGGTTGSITGNGTVGANGRLGVDSLRRRLNLLYGDAADLRVGPWQDEVRALVRLTSQANPLA